jgi:hypothetical protein
MIDDLGENSLAKIHPSLSEICAGVRGDGQKPIPAKKQFKSRNLQIGLNCLAINWLRGMEKSSPGQQ